MLKFFRTLRSEDEYKCALKLIEQFWKAEEDSLEDDLLDAIGTLVADYEDIHYPIEPPAELEAIKFRLEQEIG